jgi:benzoyl-CoA reductase subunit C
MVQRSSQSTGDLDAAAGPIASDEDPNAAETDLRQFGAIYDHPHDAAKEWKTHNDGFVVGYLGLDVPVELIIAAGMLPVRIRSDGPEYDEHALGLVEGESNPGLLSLISRLIDGTYDYLDALAICSRPPHYGEVFGLLRELKHNDPRMFAPRIALADIHHADRISTRQFNRDSVRQFRKTLERWSGKAISEARLSDAVSLVNKNRRLLSKVSNLRTGNVPKLSGMNALKIIGSSELMPRERHNDLLQGFLDHSDDLAALPGMRLLYSGSETDRLAIYELIEAAGTVIVADDQDRGSRSVEGLVNESEHPIDAITSRYQFRPPSASGFGKVCRINYLESLFASAKPDGVVFHIQASDHPAAWEYPVLRQVLTDIGMPQIELGPQKFQIEDPEQISKRLRQFAGNDSNAG